MTRFYLSIAIISACSCTLAQAVELEEVLVTAKHGWEYVDVATDASHSPDPAQWLAQVPGVSVNQAGPVTGLPQIRGMYGTRVATVINGQTLGGAGPNAMDPPISYATGQLKALKVYRGIAPVSAAQESIGGVIQAESQRGEFSNHNDFALTGAVNLGAASVNSSYHADAAVYISNRQQRIKIAVMSEAGDDAKFPGGDVLPTEYERQRYDLGWGIRSGAHQLQLDYTRVDTGDAGTPSLPMDIQWIEGDLFSLEYQWDMTNNTRLTARIYGSELDHGMTNYHLRPVPMRPSMFRRTLADASNTGFKVDIKHRDEKGYWSVGLDGHDSQHNATINNPNAAAFIVRNFDNAQRRVVGVYAERLHTINNKISAEFGVRFNRVATDADAVDGTPAMMMPPATMLRDTFNTRDRAQHDNNIDAVAKLWYQATTVSKYYVGIARKTRSPSYQERYLWLPMQATGGLADGLTYTGNTNLDPETAHEIELGVDYSTPSFRLSPRAFYRDMTDYIQGVPTNVPAAIMMVQMMNRMNGSNNPAPLRFANVDATLYGADVDMVWQLTPQWTLEGQAAYVRGQREDINDNLYRIAPLNAQLGLRYNASRWSATVETRMVNQQGKVSRSNLEAATPGYGVVNLRGTWQANAQLQFTAGVDNLFDKSYRDHLSGYNRVRNPDVAMGQRLPGYGRNGWVRVSYEF